MATNEDFDRRRWRYQLRREALAGTRTKETPMATNRNAPPPIAGAGGAGTNPQMVARAYAAIGRLVNEGGLPPLAVKKLVAANTRLLGLTLGEAEPASTSDAAAETEEGAPSWDADPSEQPADKFANEMVDPAAAIERMNSNVAKASADVPETARTLVPSPFLQKSIRQWAQGDGARRATLPRPQRRG